MSNPTPDYRGDLPANREQAIPEMIGRTWNYAIKNYARIIPIFLAAGVLNGLVFVLFMGPTTMPNISNYSNLSQSQLLNIAGQAFTALGYTWVQYFLSWLILYFAAGVAIWRMSRDNLNPFLVNNEAGANKPGLDYAKLGITTFVSVLLISLGLFLLVIGAIVLGVMFYLVLPATVLEGRSAGSAISRSRHLVSGRWFKTFVLLAGWLLFAYIISGFASGLISYALPTSTGNVIAIFVGNFALALLFPFVAASMLVLFQSSYSPAMTMRRAPPPAPPSPYDSMKPEPMWPNRKDVNAYRFCPYCGASLMGEERYCHNCGREIKS